MKRRTFLKSLGATALASGFSAPVFAQAAKSKVLKFVPQTALVGLDPLTTNAPANNQGYYIYDTLYGVDNNFRPLPQMAEGHTVSSDRLTWDIKLRPGQKFHDGEAVLARDCVASIKRWWQRDAFGQSLESYTNELTAADDKTLRFRLKKPFELLPDALAHPLAAPCFMMPERFASRDVSKVLGAKEMIGSGPLKFIESEFVSGQRSVYEKNAAYVPRQEKAEHTAGGKVVYFDRVEWTTIADPATAAAALQSGEIDWWDVIQLDLVELLRSNKGVTVTTSDPGYTFWMRFNSGVAPTNNPALRRVIASAISQTDILQAIVGSDPSLQTECYSQYNCVLPGYEQVGKSLMAGKKDYKALAEQVKKAGYNGEKVVLLRTVDALASPAAPVIQDVLQKIGINSEMQNVDLATLFTRRASQAPIAQGGWSMFISYASTAVAANPAVYQVVRGQGLKGYVGNFEDQKLEELITQWIDAPPSEQERFALLTKIQERQFEMVSTVPLGGVRLQTAFRSDLTGYLPSAVPVPWNIRRA